jgi:hypothetical protein
MKEIILTNNMVALVSECDYERVTSKKWYALTTKYTNYVRCTQNGQLLHRYILGVSDSKIEIDHKDHNGLNNTRDNLRIATRSDNVKNRRKHRGKSKYMGVTKHRFGGWQAQITVERKQKYLGLFENEIDAATAYNIAAIATGNVFYRLNDV